MARVLVVDDAAFMRKMVTDALTKAVTRSSARRRTATRPSSASAICGPR
jgi:chemotaxis response regulator CheB